MTTLQTFSDIEQFPNPAAPASGAARIIGSSRGLFPNPMFDRAAGRLGKLIRDRAPHFEFHKIRRGGNHAVILVNGFLSQGDHDTADWEAAIEDKFGDATWYHLDWDACRGPKRQAIELLTLDSLLKLPMFSMQPMPPVVGGMLSWHAAMSAAERAGELLAEAIQRTPDWRFTLAGHSLGGRVVHFALKGLAKSPHKRVENAYLLGAAVGGGTKDSACWAKAAGAVEGRVFNCYSNKDAILSRLYRGANLWMSEPAGHSGIVLKHAGLFHLDCQHLVDSHFTWKSKFSTILEQLADD